MSVPGRVVDLVERFEADRKTYRSTAYKEEWIRQDFIDPLFETLGWDVSNKSGVPVGPQREVIPEDAIRVRGATKAPDYGFYVGGARKFFVEAKKPSVNLAGDTSPAFQLRRYAWSAKLSLSVLTDFEEMALYDCRFEPKKDDGPSRDRENDSAIVAIEMKVDSHEGLVRGVPQTIAYRKLLEEDTPGTPFLFVTLGVGEFYHAPLGELEKVKWVCLRDFHEALKAITADDPLIEAWKAAVGNELDLQDRCFSCDRSRIEEYRGKTWILYLLGHLKEKLTESLTGRDIGIDPFVYTAGSGPDTILYFGRSRLPQATSLPGD